MDISIFVAVCAVVVTAAAMFIDLLQTRSIRKINARIEAESKLFEDRGSIGEQFGDWLLDKETDKEDSPTNLEACASLVGKQIANSFSMGLRGIQSGESRTLRSVEQKVLEGLQTPESNALMSFVDKIGIDRELAGLVLNVLQQRGLTDQILKNNGSGSKGTW